VMPLSMVALGPLGDRGEIKWLLIAGGVGTLIAGPFMGRNRAMRAAGASPGEAPGEPDAPGELAAPEPPEAP